jgi:hypothetical protein
VSKEVLKIHIIFFVLVTKGLTRLFYHKKLYVTQNISKKIILYNTLYFRKISILLRRKKTPFISRKKTKKNSFSSNTFERYIRSKESRLWWKKKFCDIMVEKKNTRYKQKPYILHSLRTCKKKRDNHKVCVFHLFHRKCHSKIFFNFCFLQSRHHCIL